MRIGLIAVDGHNFPNLPLMKLSAWHKKNGDSVEWYEPLQHGYPNPPMDRVYVSKVFRFSPDYAYHINAKEIIKGGSGYCIELVDGKEVYHTEKDINLPYEIEHIYPDYSIYPELAKDSAYGFLTRGCPCDCSFCHVCAKEGKCSVKVADLSEFWRGQKNIVLLDPNITACKDWKELFQQLIDSQAWIDFTQGLRIHMMTEEKVELIKRMKIKNIHFAWDKYEDKDIVIPKLKMFKELTGYGYWKMTVYMLCNYNTTFEEDLERAYILRDLGYNPYVMLYDKEHLPKGHTLRKFQRYVCSRRIFRVCKSFDDYQKAEQVTEDNQLSFF